MSVATIPDIILYALSFDFTSLNYFEEGKLCFINVTDESNITIEPVEPIAYPRMRR